jgi:hypothetical protein
MKLKIILPIVAMLLSIAFMTSCKDDDIDIDDGVNPTIESTTPSDKETGTVRNPVISATFSDAMEPSTINTASFTLEHDDGNITGEVEYADKIATFKPSGTLTAKTRYTATITTSVESLTGKALENTYIWDFTTGGSTESIEAVDLGAAGNYVILAKTAINNSGTSALSGDLGLSPAATSYITGLALTDYTGYATSAQVTGQVFAADMADPTPMLLTTAVENMITAYNDAAGRTKIDFLELGTGNIGSKTLTPGIYKWTNTVTVPTNVTISGSSTDVWIFQIAENLSVSTDVNVILIGGAQASNIFWQVAGEATFGADSHFEGVILSMTYSLYTNIFG